MGERGLLDHGEIRCLPLPTNAVVRTSLMALHICSYGCCTLMCTVGLYESHSPSEPSRLNQLRSDTLAMLS